MKAKGWMAAVIAIGLLVCLVVAFAMDQTQATNELTASPRYAFVDGSKPGETGQVAFTLVNHSQRRLTILDVERSCSCLVTTELKGRILERGQSCRLAARIDIPDSGIQTERVTISYDGEQSPLRLTIEAVGRQSLPYLLDKPPKQATFFDLASTSAVEKIRLTTCEPANAQPWLGPMTCDLAEVVVERGEVTEHRVGAVLVRQYEYRVGWQRLPTSLEFFGKLRLATTSGSSSSIEIGNVAGTRAREDKFLPAVARPPLQPVGQR